MREALGRVAFDLRRHTVRDLNQFLHGDLREVREVVVENPDGAHSLAVGRRIQEVHRDRTVLEPLLAERLQ